MNDAVQKIREVGLLPRVDVKGSEEAFTVGKALVEGDIPVLEIPFEGESTFDSLRVLSSDLPELLTGVTGIFDKERASKAISAGAGFVSGYGYSKDISTLCDSEGVPFIPCVSTAGEIGHVLSWGVKTVFFSPAELSGGKAAIEFFANIFPQMTFIPSGGVAKEDLDRYLTCRNVHAVSVEWINDRSLIEKGQFEKITTFASEAALAVHNFSLLHLGINNEKPEDALVAAKKMAFLFGFNLRERPNSMFAGLGFEFMKTPDLGKNGHIAIGVNNVSRAVAYLGRKGIRTLPGTERVNDDGSIRRVYLDLELSGFAVHLRLYPWLD